MSRNVSNVSRTPFFHSNRVRKRRLAIVTASVTAAITAATVFLCIRPVVVPDAQAASLPAVPSAYAGQTGQTGRRASQDGQAAATVAAMASGALVTLVDRHASDAVRIADATADDDLGWDYVQLRL